MPGETSVADSGRGRQAGPSPSPADPWPSSRRAGICLHLSSLPGPEGIGTIGATARAVVDKLAEMGMTVWQFLPIGPTGFGDSPYQALSDFAGNELLIDLASLEKDGLLTAAEVGSLHRPSTHRVDFAGLIPRKTALLQRAAERFAGQVSAEQKIAFEEFRHTAGKWLDDYALYRCLKEKHGGRAWPDWDAPYRSRDRQALAQIAHRAQGDLECTAILQFLFDRQWRAFRRHARRRGVSLFGDLPIYLARDSVDCWAHRHLLQLDRQGRPLAVAGVPPDYFSETGQLWGNPLYDWPVHAADDFSWWTRRLAHAMSRTDLVRIDHFRGFEAYWAVPPVAATAAAGEWLPGPGTALLDAVERTTGCGALVAEDLGVITPAVRDLRKRFRIPGMTVLQFDVDRDDFNPDDIDEHCVCYTGTHDSDTTRGWFDGAGGDRRSRGEIRKTRKRALAACGGRAADIHTNMVRLAFDSAARIALAPAQDFLGLGAEARLNRPGAAAGNWRWRLSPDAFGPRLQADIRRIVDKSGRLAR